MDKRRKPFVHGTVAGHTRHRRLNEAPCEECRIAFNEYVKAYKKKNPEKTKQYAKTSYDRVKADPEKWRAKLDYIKKIRGPYDYQANKEYQKWYNENVRKPRMLEKRARD